MIKGTTGEKLYPFIYDGVVVSNEDPLGLYRVKVRVPGLLEPESDWAYPMATIGGGSANRGGFLAPAEGASVGVFFNGGEINQPRYFCGFWKPGDMPEESNEGDPDTFALSIGGIRMTLSKGAVDDDWPEGRGFFRVASIPGGKENFVQVDGETNSVAVFGITNLFLGALGRVKVSGIVAEILRRVVLALPRPIQ